MPLYEYRCQACHQRFEVIRKFSDPELEACTLCGAGPVERLLSSPAIQFKGSGWYITDYSRKGKTEGSDSPGADSAGTTKTAESTPASGDAAATAKTETAAPATPKSAASE
jgi:putative FmdB family regulatory protein